MHDSLGYFLASIALAQDVPIGELSRRLGHRSVKTTIDIHGHPPPSAWGRCPTVLRTSAPRP